MQRMHFQVRVVFSIVNKSWQDFFRSLWYCDKKQIECGLAWHWWNSTDLGLIGRFLINLKAEIVACVLSFRKSRHKPNLENTSKYVFFPRFGGKKWRRSEHAHASYPGLFFRPLGFSPCMGREERRVQGLDYAELSIVYSLFPIKWPGDFAQWGLVTQ